MRDIVVRNAQVALFKVGLNSKGEWSLHVEVPLTLADSGAGLPGHLLAGWPGLVGLLQERDTDSTAESLKATEGALPGQFALTIWGSVEREGAPLLMASCSTCGPAEAKVRVEGKVDTAFVRFALKVPWGNLTECMDMRSLASAMGGPCWLDLIPTEQPETRTPTKALPAAEDRQTNLLDVIERANAGDTEGLRGAIALLTPQERAELREAATEAKRIKWAEEMHHRAVGGANRAAYIDALIETHGGATGEWGYLNNIAEQPWSVLGAEYQMITGKTPSATATEARLRLLIGNALAEREGMA